MRIAFISTILHYPWGGADTMWTRAAEAAAQRGDHLLLGISALTAQDGRIEALVRAGATLVLRTPTRRRSVVNRVAVKLGVPLGRSDPLVDGLRAFRPDLVVISGGGVYDLIIEDSLRTWLWEQRVPYRYIANWQAERPELGEGDRALALAGLRQADDVTFVSTRNLEVTRRHLLDPLPNAFVRHYPLNGPEASPLPWPEGSMLRFATLGRLEPVKGLDLLLHAIALALGDEAGWELNLHGAGRDEAYLAKIIAHLGLQDRVRLAGYVADRDALWQRHHLLLSPALDEGVPMTIPEALLRARPVLATAVGAAAEWIVPARNGWLTPAPTVPLLTEALRSVWAARLHWEQWGRQGAADARAFYRPDDYLTLLEPVSTRTRS